GRTGAAARAWPGAALALAVLAACSSYGETVGAMLPGPPGLLIAYTEVPDSAAKACEAAIRTTGWKIDASGPAVGYMDTTVVEYTLRSGEDGETGYTRCIFDRASGKASFGAPSGRWTMTGPTTALPLAVMGACRDEIEGAGWTVLGLMQTVPVEGPAELVYRVRRPDASVVEMRCTYDGGTRKAKLVY
ncbi:MAG: hypothetical protein IRZ00_13720, partial [Gemmatimonadetes bacterium]|nr:hypothetical protein [Gemmatimonadota bacterium]